ncbi:MAG: hypothetical protein K8I00_03245 [Candidatus Omnitrophica bacterium]|nr:hypothetical protein [Candidatus Omnitrophota bacterium]
MHKLPITVFWCVLCVVILAGCSLAGGAQGARKTVGGAEERLDVSNYIGERLHLSQIQPAYISRLQLNLIFPEEHKLLCDAKPNVALYSAKGKLVWQAVIEENQADYAVNKKISAPLFYAKVGVYYCKEGDQGLCMIQNVLYEVSSSDALAPGPLMLEYRLPGSYF